MIDVKNLGIYELEAEIGSGGQATVFRARSSVDGSRVAVKIAVDPSGERLDVEARALMELDHPGICPVLEADLDHEPPYIALPFYPRGNLARLMAGMPKGHDGVRVGEIAEQLLEALAYAHGKGLVHRDLKPENVLMDGDHCRISDFGLVRRFSHDGIRPSLPSATSLVGTPLYLAPEQEDPDRRNAVDGRADLYALGKLLYFLLTGQPPRTIMPLSRVRPELDPAWEELLWKLLAERPEDRPPTAGAVLELLREIGAQRPASVPAPAAAPVTRADLDEMQRKLELERIERWYEEERRKILPRGGEPSRGLGAWAIVGGPSSFSGSYWRRSSRAVTMRRSRSS